MKDLWYFEKEATQQGRKKIAGIDEAGRGPLAGPVVSAAMIPKSYLLKKESTYSVKSMTGRLQSVSA